MKYLAESPSTHRWVAKAAEIEEVLEHPFLDLLSSVNEFQNGFDLIEELFLHFDLTGNAYWVTLNSNLGLPDEIWPLMSQYMKIIPDKQKFISHYEYSISSTEKHIIKPEDMVHFRAVNPRSAFYGIGPLQACVVAADLSMDMNTYEASLMKNSAMPEFAIKLPENAGVPPEKEQERTTKKWVKRFGGIKRAGKPAYLFGGADIKQISLTPKEMAFLAGHKATMNEIAAVFGVPVSKLTTESVNRANADAGERQYMKDTVRPRLRKVEQKINESLLPKYDPNLFCAFDDPVPEDKEFRLKEQDSHIKNGYSSINEERQIDGLKEVEWGDVPFLPVNLAPIGSSLPEESKQITEKIKTVKSSRKLPPLGHPTNFVNEPFVRAVQEVFREQKKEVLDNFDRETKAVKIQTDDLLSGIFDMTKWNKLLGEKKEPFVRHTLMNGGERALRQIAEDQIFDPTNPKVISALEKQRIGSVNSVNSEIVKKLRKTLSIGLESAETVVELRKRVMAVFDGLEKWGAQRVARTETIWAWNEGAVQGYIQSGVVEKKEWLSSGDSRSCDFCPTLDGKVISIEANFFDKGSNYDVGERSLSFTYEDVSHPPLHPNCRCTIVPVIEEL
jgi:HK97 family phage portal protein